jgi:hypothetical protein
VIAKSQHKHYIKLCGFERFYMKMRKSGKRGHTPNPRPDHVRFAGGCCERCGHDDIQRLRFYRFDEASEEVQCQGKCMLEGPLRNFVVVDITEIRVNMPVLVMLCYKCANAWLRQTREELEAQARDRDRRIAEEDTRHDFDNWVL